jgi:hypothetical protein
MKGEDGVRLFPSSGYFMVSHIFDFVEHVALDHPILFSFGVTIIFLYLTSLPALSGCLLGGNKTGEQIGESLGRLLGVFILIIILDNLGWLHIFITSRGANVRNWLLVVPVIVYEAAAFPRAYTQIVKYDYTSLPYLLSLIFNTLSAALFEEIAFRGLILYALLRSWAYLRFGTLMAILVSSIFFGLVHIVKQKEENTDRWVILQGAWAISMGVLFGSFAVMSGSIWPAVFLHGTWIVMLKINLLANPNKEQKLSSLISPELLVIPLALYGFILL